MTSGIQMLGLTGIGTSEDMTADDYLRVDSTNPGLRQQVMTAINNSPTPIDLIVTTKGLPLRITVTEPEPATLPGNMFPQYVRFRRHAPQHLGLESVLESGKRVGQRR